MSVQTSEKESSARADEAPAPPPRLTRWYAAAALLALSTLLLTLAFAPYEQFYLACVGLVPWLVVVMTRRTVRGAALWGWVGGVCFYGVNVSWLWTATVPGTVGVVVILACYWALAAGVIRVAAVRAHPLLAVLIVPVAWTGAEWLRGNLFTGFPWLLIGHSQSPVLVMCQVADALGVYGITFWVLAINGLAALFVLDLLGWRGSRRADFLHDEEAARKGPRPPGSRARELIPAAVVVAVLIVATFAYGRFRFAQDTLYPGPRVMVVQPNHQHARGGAKLVTQEQQIEFHLRVTRVALAKDKPDLVVWSETVMPPLNAEARDALRRESSGKFLEEIHQMLANLAREHRTSLVTGAYYVGGWKPVDGKLTATDIRNSAYVYDPTGTQFAGRYDKIHLVPFSEIMPMRQTIPILHRALLRLAAYSAEYPLVPGPADALTVFTLRPFVNDTLAAEPSWKFVTPICSEDFDAPLIASMFRPGPDGRKRADFIANLTNDGWFRGNMRDQHLQCAIFRSIENRAPTARADNTGISGFIDPLGRTSNLIEKGEEGTRTQQLMLDRRVSLYSRVGDAFAIGCFVLTCAIGLSPLILRIAKRRAKAERKDR